MFVHHLPLFPQHCVQAIGVQSGMLDIKFGKLTEKALTSDIKREYASLKSRNTTAPIISVTTTSFRVMQPILKLHLKINKLCFVNCL